MRVTESSEEVWRGPSYGKMRHAEGARGRAGNDGAVPERFARERLELAGIHCFCNDEYFSWIGGGIYNVRTMRMAILNDCGKTYLER